MGVSLQPVLLVLGGVCADLSAFELFRAGSELDPWACGKFSGMKVFAGARGAEGCVS